jgi:hypothetical protein
MADKHAARADVSAEPIVEKIQFHLIFAVTFIALLVTALATLLLPWRWQRTRSSNDKKGFVRCAWQEAGTFVELAYMG